MRALGTDPTKKLVTPRIIATITMLPLLTVLCNFMGMVGGWLVSLHKLRISSSLFWLSSFDALDYSDLVQSLVKPIFFAFIISMTGCHCGLTTRGGTQGVGRSTTQAVVFSSILVIVADYFLNNVIIELTR
jgi:phospholipid/cholesterol/gamma-HCH transport system permease protein